MAQQESFPVIQERRAEVNPIPLTDPQADEPPQAKWITSFDAPPQVLADPLPVAEMGSNIVDLSYEQSPKHHSNVKGNVSRAPTNGQSTLDISNQIKPTSSRRIGFDTPSGEIVIFDETGSGVYHGHVRTWEQLTQEMKNVLINNGTHDRKGKVH